MSKDAPLPVTREQIMAAMLFAIAQNPSGLPDAREMREALDDATHHQLGEEDLDRLAQVMVGLLLNGGANSA